jgi:hypothetical protein
VKDQQAKQSYVIRHCVTKFSKSADVYKRRVCIEALNKSREDV